MVKAKLFLILYYSQILRLSKKFHFHYFIRKFIKKDDVVIDIGANWGCYTRLFKKWGADVYAVEPVAKFRPVLRRIIGLDKLRVLDYALGDENKFIGMEQWRDTDGAYRVSDKGQMATMVKGSWLFGDIDKLDFIKIDVEESEVPIIKDMKELIEKHKPMILIETGFIREVLNLLPDYNVLHSFQNEYLLCCS